MSNSEKPKSSWRERRQSIKHKWLAPFIFPEWLCERVSNLLGRWAFLDILGHAGRLTILIAVIFYFTEAEDRRKAKHYEAWQVINAAQGKPGSGGRIDALQDLHRDGISLAGVDISKAHLPKLNLENALLVRANLSEAFLEDANFRGAHFFAANLAGADLFWAGLAGADLSDANLTEAFLDRANLAEAILREANLAGADLTYADLAGAMLTDANLAGAELWNANLAEAYLERANIAEANLWEANLTEAYLERANLTGANLWEANLTEAYLERANLDEAGLTKANLKNIENWQRIESIENANIYGVKNPPDGFIEWAKERGAVSIEGRSEWRALLDEKRGTKK